MLKGDWISFRCSLGGAFVFAVSEMPPEFKSSYGKLRVDMHDKAQSYLAFDMSSMIDGFVCTEPIFWDLSYPKRKAGQLAALHKALSDTWDGVAWATSPPDIMRAADDDLVQRFTRLSNELLHNDPTGKLREACDELLDRLSTEMVSLHAVSQDHSWPRLPIWASLDGYTGVKVWLQDSSSSERRLIDAPEDTLLAISVRKAIGGEESVIDMPVSLERRWTRVGAKALGVTELCLLSVKGYDGKVWVGIV